MFLDHKEDPGVLAFDLCTLEMHLDQCESGHSSVSQGGRHLGATPMGGVGNQRDFLQDEEGRRDSVAALKETPG